VREEMRDDDDDDDVREEMRDEDDDGWGVNTGALEEEADANRLCEEVHRSKVCVRNESRGGRFHTEEEVREVLQKQPTESSKNSI
jgi:hypothetical protein